MRGISSYDSSSISTLFSSMNSSSSGSNFLGINLQDYANIKSGAYGKLMKSYYKMQTGDTKTSSKDKANSSTSTSKDSSKILANVESAAEELTATAKDLYSTKSNSVFSKKDGNYDSKKISDKLNSFVEDYNDLLTSSAKSTASRIESSIESLKTVTADKSKDLEDIGISVDSATLVTLAGSGWVFDTHFSLSRAASIAVLLMSLSSDLRSRIFVKKDDIPLDFPAMSSTVSPLSFRSWK